MVIGPRTNPEYDIVELEINIRILDGEELYAVDGTFTSEKDRTTYLDEIYPELINRFEENFPESQLQYYKPERHE